MTPTQYALLAGAAALLGILALKIRRAVRLRAECRRRDFSRKLETVLQPRETVKVICPQKKGSCILTSKRLLFDTKQGFTAVKLTDIQRIQGTNAAGNRTTAAKNMVSLTVKAEKDCIIENSGEEFLQLHKLLAAKVKKQKTKK